MGQMMGDAELAIVSDVCLTRPLLFILQIVLLYDGTNKTQRLVIQAAVCTVMIAET